MRVGARAAGGLAALPLLQACGGGGEADGQTVVPPLAVKNSYRQTNLAASKASCGAAFTLSDMADAWGIAIRPAGAGGHFWVLGGGTSWQFVGDVTASSDPKFKTLFQDGLGQVFLPGADALATDASLGKATGTAFNGAPIASDNFRVTAQSATVIGTAVEFDGSARLVFVTDSGKLSAWTDRAKDGSTVRVDGPAQMVYDGSALGMSLFGVALKTDAWDTLWAADFGATPQIRQFDKTWQLVAAQGFAIPFATGPLRDANGFIVDANKTLPSEEDSLDAAEEKKAGNVPNRGKVVEYTFGGDQVMVYDDAGRLNAPWGVAVAPADFGLMSNTLLVSNFGGAGKIAAFNQTTGRFIDCLGDEADRVIGLDGTWALMFGNGVSLGDTNALYCAAGTEGEAAGLFGSLRYAG